MSEWLLFNGKWAISHGHNKIHFYGGDDDDDNDVCFVLDQQAELDFYSPRLDMSPHSTRYSDSKPTSLCSYYLMLRA